MDHNFWLKRWQANEIGFHGADVQPALAKHWSKLDAPKGARVFVPLCGKSVDMVWLASQGLMVVGAELSEVAIDAFFAEHGLVPHTREEDAFKIKSAGAFELWCGDFFALEREKLGSVPFAYDRAALVAMPPDMQQRYAKKMAGLMPAHSKTLLVGLAYNQGEMNGPPFSVPRERVRELFDPAFDVSVIDARDGLAKGDHLAKRGVTWLEEATYLLRRKA
jgi:thiopurine S-methyltransferase